MGISGQVTGLVLGVAAALLTMSAAQADMTFLDHRGKTITLKEPPKRIVSMFASGPLVHTAVEGTPEHFVGVNVKGKKTYSNGIYEELLPELLKLNFDVAGEGFKPNVEAILALKPDAILQWTFDPKIIEPLERVNLTVIGWDCCTKEQRRDYLRLAGYTTARIDRAQTILALQDKSENGLKDIFAKAKLEKPTSLLVVDQVKESIQVIANSSQDYSLSGTVNLAADNTGEWWRTIDAEQLLVWNPAIIVIPAYAIDLKPADIYGNAMFASVDAVKNKRVYKFPQFNRSPDSAEIYLSDDWLARVAHPDLFKADKFRATLQDSYKQIYLKDLTEDQIRLILELEQNKDSAGYNDILG